MSSPHKSSSKRPLLQRGPVLIGTGLILLLIGVGVGYLVGQGNEDTTKVSSLSQSVASLESRTTELESQNTSSATTGTSNESSSTATTTTSASPELKIGQAGTVGSLSIRTTSFVKLSSSGEQVIWRLTLSVRNHGSEGAQPFCGSGQASLTDSEGRTYEGESVVNEAGSVNCGNKVQPGLSESPYVIDFKASRSAKPASLSIWGEEQYKEQPKTWAP